MVHQQTLREVVRMVKAMSKTVTGAARKKKKANLMTRVKSLNAKQKNCSDNTTNTEGAKLKDVVAKKLERNLRIVNITEKNGTKNILNTGTRKGDNTRKTCMKRPTLMKDPSLTTNITFHLKFLQHPVLGCTTLTT